MFDLQDEENTRVKKGLASRMADDEGEALPAKRKAGEPDLDDPEHMQLHGRLMGFYQRELDRQADNRVDQAIDADYYDNDQWSEEDAQALRDRGQAPLCYNVISQTINWIIGSEKRGRTDFNVLPRGKEDAKPAERKTQLLKYLSDVNKTPFHRSRAFEDCVKVGIGWLEDGVFDGDDGEPVYSRYENWRNMLWDSASTEFDIEDGRYVIRIKWADLDVAQAYFPNRAELLERSANADDRYGSDFENGDEVMDYAEDEREINARGIPEHMATRPRVRLIEVWFKKPISVKKMIGGQFSGERFDENNQQHLAELEAGSAMVAIRPMMRTHVAVMTSSGLCALMESPYRHNRYPFTPIWGYRRDRDGMPYGVIRSLRDIQDDINKRASKALYILSTNKVLYEKGAITDMKLFMEELARPDGMLEIEPNKKVELQVDRELAPAHLELMSRSISMIQSISGVTDELMGRTTNAKSGVAIQARQEQGSMSTSKLFDNLRFAVQCQGEKQLSLVEQYFTEQKQFRITNSRGTPDYIMVNDGLPENDITRSKADFVISDAEWRASLRQAQAEQLMEMMTRLPPEVAMVMLDLVVESMDLPNREELVKRIRQVTGMRDPDATELTPEEQQAQQAKAKQDQFQQEMAMAQLRKLISEATKNEASVQKTGADIAKVQADTSSVNVQTQATAVNAAQTAMMAPGLLPVADGILDEGGFVSATDQALAQQQAAAEQAQQQAMAQQQQEQQAQQAMEQQAAQQQQAAQGMPPA